MSNKIPFKDLVSEDGAHELATSPDMQPYLRLMKADCKTRTPRLSLIAWRYVAFEPWVS